jgi:hypothetical protein
MLLERHTPPKPSSVLTTMGLVSLVSISAFVRRVLWVTRGRRDSEAAQRKGGRLRIPVGFLYAVRQSGAFVRLLRGTPARARRVRDKTILCTTTSMDRCLGRRRQKGKMDTSEKSVFRLPLSQRVCWMPTVYDARSRH